MLFCKGLSNIRPLCNYRTAWNFSLSALLYSTVTVLGFQPANKRQYIVILLIRLCRWQYDNPHMWARLKVSEWAGFYFTQQACEECRLDSGKRHCPKSIPGCIFASTLFSWYPQNICFTCLWFAPTPTPCCQLLGGRKSSVYSSELPGGPVIFSEQ